VGSSIDRIWFEILKYLQRSRNDAIRRKGVIVLNRLKNKAGLFFAVLFSFVVSSEIPALASISHIHQLEIFKDKILLGTHEGLFELQSKGKMTRIGRDTFDVMGLAVLGDDIYASGHPGVGDTRPNPLGLLTSSDSGKSWRQVSLKGKVDFHLLEVSPQEILGGDSASGELLYSNDFGKTWERRGKNVFEDIALSPSKAGFGFGISDGRVFSSKDRFKSWQELKLKGDFTQIAWTNKTILLADQRTLLVSRDLGKSWRKLVSFKGLIGVLKATPTLIVATVGDKVYESTNAGISFSLRN
jgi:photosystem II stability/assembly factor-like uncharacterized protein